MVLSLVIPTCILPNLPPWAITSPPTPTPPVTCNAPLSVDVAAAAFSITTALVVLLPLSVMLCKVLVFQIVILPVLVLTAVSVPAVIVETYCPAAPVRTGLP